MIYWELLWTFFKIGTFAFGGHYGAVSLIREAALTNGWMSEDMFAYFLALSESTPGPLMVNIATFIGSSQAGFWGAALATTGVVLPSFVIILSVMSFLESFNDNQHVQAPDFGESYPQN